MSDVMYAVAPNSDLTEGRGVYVVRSVHTNIEEAVRAGANADAGGRDAPVYLIRLGTGKYWDRGVYGWHDVPWGRDFGYNPFPEFSSKDRWDAEKVKQYEKLIAQFPSTKPKYDQFLYETLQKPDPELKTVYSVHLVDIGYNNVPYVEPPIFFAKNLHDCRNFINKQRETAPYEPPEFNLSVPRDLLKFRGVYAVKKNTVGNVIGSKLVAKQGDATYIIDPTIVYLEDPELTDPRVAMRAELQEMLDFRSNKN